MSELSPGQSPGKRTAVTAKVILVAGTAAWASSLVSGSFAVAMLACLIIVAGAGLLFAARQAD